MRAFPIALAALALCGCASVQKLDAAGDVHALLVAIRDDDQAAFDAHVDRAALKQEIRDRLVERARGDERLSGLAAILAPGLAEIAGETLVQPGVFRAVADHYGYSRETRIPGQIGISRMLRRTPDGRMCAVKKPDGPCLLTFSKGEDGHWRLSGFEGDLSMLRLKS